MITFGTDVLELWWRVNLLHRDAITEGHLKVWPNIRLNAGSKKKVRSKKLVKSNSHKCLFELGISTKDFQKMENILKNNLWNSLISFEEAFWPELLNFLAHCERLEGLPKRYFHEKSDINKAKCLFTFR